MSVDTLNADLATLRQGLKARQRGTGSTKNTLPALAALDRVEAALAELVARATQAEADRDDYRAANESVRVCADHTSDIIEPRGECLVCEAARLREERDEARNLHDDAVMDRAAFLIRAQVAEARCARLQQALATAGTAIERATFDAHDREWARQVMASIREALAGPDTPADSPKKDVDDEWMNASGFWGRSDRLNPADSQPEETT